MNSKKIVPEKKAHFYWIWVSKFIRFSNDKPVDQINDNDINRYINELSKNYQQWQVDQAAQAIQIYLFYKRDEGEVHVIQSNDTDEQWKAVANEMTNMLRLKQRSRETEKSYMYWLRDFYRFLRSQSPYLLDRGHVKNFLTYLAVERNVAPSTQNQGLNALLFFFRHVLEKDLGDISDAVRAKKRRRLPIVLTMEETTRLFSHLDGIHLLIKGSSLRLRAPIKTGKR